MNLTIFEIELILKTEHSDPHRILGLHEIKKNGKKVLVCRAFIPDAKEIYCIDASEENLIYPLEKIHDSGFFETKILRKEWFQYKLKIVFEDGSRWEQYDPYSFAPSISEYDTYLYGMGNHYEIYAKLGANIAELNGISGVSFGVWAPNAKRVSVIGDFNHWDGRRNPMRNLNNSGIWEIFIPGLNQNDCYKFEIKSDKGQIFEKSDPCAKFAQLRPSTASLVYNINNYKWKDKRWLNRRKEKDYLKSPMNIYEVHMGSWKRGEDGEFLTYEELAETLIPYVKEMGYTHIELMPITEYPYDGSWGYQVTGYFAPTSRYGNPDEFMYFIDQCHGAGIGVIADWVPAHFPKDACGLGKFDGTSLYEHDNPVRGEHPDWGTLIFNYGRNEVSNFLISSALFWIEQYHIDGLRVDAVASMLYLDYGINRQAYIPNQYGGREDFEAVEFLKHLNSIMLKRNPDVLMIAEESTSWPGVTRDTKDGGLGFSYKWNLGWMNDVLEYFSTEPLYRKYYNNNITFGMMYAYNENFILPFSHDEVVHGKKSLINKMPGDIWKKCAGLRNALVFMFGHPGKKLLFMGGEFGQFREWTEKESLEWFMLQYEHHSKIKDFVKELNYFYLKEDALWYNDHNIYGFEWINCDRPELSIVSFARKGKKENSMLVFVCNFTDVTRKSFKVGVPKAGKYIEVMNTDKEEYGGSGVLNIVPIKADDIPWDNKAYSIEITVPPMATTIFKYRAK